MLNKKNINKFMEGFPSLHISHHFQRCFVKIASYPYNLETKWRYSDCKLTGGMTLYKDGAVKIIL